jgi:ABC-type transporter Mla subunit MlaD
MTLLETIADLRNVLSNTPLDPDRLAILHASIVSAIMNDIGDIVAEKRERLAKPLDQLNRAVEGINTDAKRIRDHASQASSALRTIAAILKEKPRRG